MSEVFRVNKTKDYTVMCNHHFKNKNLSLRAKGLLSLMLSLPDDWNYTIKGLTALSKDGRDSVITALKELEKEKYIIRRRLRNVRGQVTTTEYIISETPITENPTQENPTQENPTQENPTQAKPIQEKPKQVNPTQSNTYQLNTYISNTKSINHSSNIQTDSRIENSSVENYVENFNEVEIEVKKQIDYTRFVHTDRLDEIVNIIVEFYTSHNDIKINGCTVPYNIIQNVFRKLDYDCVEYVMDCIEKQSKKSRITNMKGYLITALYNAPLTINNYYSAQCNYDMENYDN